MLNGSLTPDFLTAILLALTLGTLVGVERQWHRRLVDLKTHALVALGACLFMLLCRLPQGLQEPIRMAGQIVVGVGFIGGGILFRDGSQTKGLNTAATLWCSAALGAFCGMERWMDATCAAITIVLANTLLRRAAQFLNLKMGISDGLTDGVQFSWVCHAQDVAALRTQVLSLLESGQREVREVRQEAQDEDKVRLSVTALFEHGEYSRVSQALAERLSGLPILSASWRLM